MTSRSRSSRAQNRAGRPPRRRRSGRVESSARARLRSSATATALPGTTSSKRSRAGATGSSRRRLCSRIPLGSKRTRDRARSRVDGARLREADRARRPLLGHRRGRPRRTAAAASPVERLRPPPAWEYSGRSLRRVHWPSTAKRGELMVKELGSPLFEVVVLLDWPPNDRCAASGFDMQVRVASSISALQPSAEKALRARPQPFSRRDPRTSPGADGDRAKALELLAAGRAGRPDLRRRPSPASGRPGDRAPSGRRSAIGAHLKLVDLLVQRLTLVAVFRSSTSSRSSRVGPMGASGLLRLQAAGISVAVACAVALILPEVPWRQADRWPHMRVGLLSCISSRPRSSSRAGWQ